MTHHDRPVLLLHVGAMKTGTTYVQHLLQDNRPVLEAAGWWVPEHKRVVQATRQLLDLGGLTVGSGPDADGGVPDLAAAPKWVALLAEARERSAEPGCRGAVLSMEFLSFVLPRGAALVRDSAGDLDLHVVLTVRDAVHALPSQWQSLTRNGQDLSWPEFAAGARAPRPAPGRPAFRRTQDVPRMLRTWSGVVPPERLSVVTVPRRSDASRAVLWSRLCQVLGVDAAATEVTAFDNPQLGYGSCELMRLVNAAGLEPGSVRPYRKVVRRLTKDHLLPLRTEQSRPRCDEATAAFALDLNARTRALAADVATLVGDLADLPVERGPDEALDPGDTPAPPPVDEVLRAAAALHAGALALCAELGLEVPDDCRGPLPDGVSRAVEKVATVVGIAITGDVSHRPQPRTR